VEKKFEKSVDQIKVDSQLGKGKSGQVSVLGGVKRSNPYSGKSHLSVEEKKEKKPNGLCQTRGSDEIDSELKWRALGVERGPSKQILQGEKRKRTKGKG